MFKYREFPIFSKDRRRSCLPLLKEPGRFTHEDMKVEINNLIAPVQHKLNKEAHEIRMSEFMKDFKQLILKYGLTIKPYEIDAEYLESITYYDINDEFDRENLEDMIHDMINEAIQGK